MTYTIYNYNKNVSAKLCKSYVAECVKLAEPLLIFSLICKQTLLEQRKHIAINRPCRELNAIYIYHMGMLLDVIAINAKIHVIPMISESFRFIKHVHVSFFLEAFAPILLAWNM
jgi:hypothetical protein